MSKPLVVPVEFSGTDINKNTSLQYVLCSVQMNNRGTGAGDDHKDISTQVVYVPIHLLVTSEYGKRSVSDTDSNARYYYCY